MNHTIGWLVFLTLIKGFLCTERIPIEVDKTEQNKTAKEGSCVEIKCKVTRFVDIYNALWYWIKNATWNGTDFYGINVYSNDASRISEDFKGRVHLIASEQAAWNSGNSLSRLEQFNIRICDLRKNDTGNYMFRYVKDKNKWSTDNSRINVTVQDNPCLITFEQPPTALENRTITLKCSTPSSCSSNPQIADSNQQLLNQSLHLTEASPSKSVVSTFLATWKDDGAEFSCQTEGNDEKYLIRKIKVSVEYAPRDVVAKASSPSVNEGQDVTLSCSARGNPTPEFTWFKDQEQFSGAQWTIPSITEAQSGLYHCSAKNKHEEKRSTVSITVNYKPVVEVLISQEPSEPPENVKEGDKVAFLCNVKKSSPQPDAFAWYKNGRRQPNSDPWNGDRVDILKVQPQDSGQYECEATNTVGGGKSAPRHFQVNYKPRNTRISSEKMNNDSVSVNGSLTLTCNTEAFPQPWFTWYRYRQTDRLNLTHMSREQSLTLKKVQRADEACYRCNTSNSIDTGDVSEPLCIRVRFPPTSMVLSMEPEVTEGQPVTITCSVESFPPSRFTLTRSNNKSTLKEFPADGKNAVRHTFAATSTDANSYTCNARNSEGGAQSAPRTLVVTYAPKEVTVEAVPGLVVKENKKFRLDCRAKSHPPVRSMTWVKRPHGGGEPVRWSGSVIFVKSAGPSDAGFYSCEAANQIGTRHSEPVEMRVLYGPKHTKIIEGERRQLPDGTSIVLLSCFARCDPLARQYSWYRKADDEGRDIMVSDQQNISVSSREPGEYYCVAKNEMGQRASDPLPLFNSRVMKILKFFTTFCVLLFILSLVFLLYRHRKNKLIQQRPTNTRSCCSFQMKSSRSRNRMNEAALTGPSRSRDDLLPHQSRPDSVPASNISCVYSMVNLPAPSAQRPATQCDAQTEENALNYASLHFEKKHREPKEDVVYARVSKRKVADYENAAFADKTSQPSDYDTDTSEDEVQVTYSMVNFKPKAQHQRRRGDSSSSEENTQYSELNL